VFSTGNPYGQPQLEPPAGKYRIVGYDYGTRQFVLRERIDGRPRQRPFDERPDVIVVQRSAIPYSHIANEVSAMLPREYSLVHVIRAADLDAPGNVYDIQDGFYAPFGGFRGVTRPGPNFEIYERR
jgi:hypothetical protein